MADALKWRLLIAKGLSFENSVLWEGDGQQLVAARLCSFGVANVVVSIGVTIESRAGWFGSQLEVAALPI